MTDLIKIKVAKSELLNLYKNDLLKNKEHYAEGEISEYVSYAREDVGGWLGDKNLLGLFGIKDGDLRDVIVNENEVTITYYL